jgi:hypothetical protein
MARIGMPIPQLQRQLGHKHITVTMRYAEFHLEYSDNAPYFDAWGQALHTPVHAPVETERKGETL